MMVIVTGAAGFIGSHTVEALLALGHEVVGVDNLRTGNMQNLAWAKQHPHFTFLFGDVAEESVLEPLFSGRRSDAVIHLAALVGVAESLQKPGDNFRLNVAAVDTVARAAVRYGVRRLVLASSASVYGDPRSLPLSADSPCAPLSPYGAAKLASEKLLEGYMRGYGLECVCLRYFNVYGPRQAAASEYSGVLARFAALIQTGQAVTVYGNGRQTRDFVYVGDVAAANANAATAAHVPSGVYDVCTGLPASVLDVAAELGRTLSRSVEIRHAEPRPGDIRDSCGDPGALLRNRLVSRLTGRSAGFRAMLATSVPGSIAA